jgi:alanine-glyoxylate transaminase/serine-glyoxylate transaminase/serine-pyruvate transaminase
MRLDASQEENGQGKPGWHGLPETGWEENVMPNKELLLVPGPTPVADEIYEALAQETWGHTDPRFAALFAKALTLTRDLFNTDGEVFVVAGSGTLAMEMAVVNTVAPGEKLLVISHGYFGDRFIPLAEAFGIHTEVIRAVWGKRVDPEEVQAKLDGGTFKAVVATHVDTSTGVMADLDQLVPVVKESGALFLLDGVCATAAVEENMRKEYGKPGFTIDVVLTASQKAIGIPPGLAIVAFGPKAMDARNSLRKVPAYYADIFHWLPIMHDPGKYFSTPPVNMIYAYLKGLEMLYGEGLENRFRRHAVLGKAVRAALSVYGMRSLAEEENAAPTLSCLLYPGGVDDAAFRKRLAGKGVIVAGALGPLAGKAFRIGHMGNVTEEMIRRAVVLIGETWRELGFSGSVDDAVARFQEIVTRREE